MFPRVFFGVLFVAQFGHCCACKRSKNLTICLLSFVVVVDWCCVGTHSGFKTAFHAAGMARTLKTLL